MYTVARARETLAALLPTLDEIVALRADTAELAAAVTNGTQTSLGGTPEFKAAQARLDELVTELTAADFQVKGLAPLLLDFPSEFDGVPVLLCWLEGDRELNWYHRTDLGFAGRRPIPEGWLTSRPLVQRRPDEGVEQPVRGLGRCGSEPLGRLA